MPIWFFRASFLCGTWVFFSTLGALLDSGGTTKIPPCGVSWPLVPTPPTPCIVLRSYASECCMGHVRRVSVVSSWAFSRTQVRQRALPRQSRLRLVVRSPDSVMGTVPISGSALRTTRRTLRHEVGLGVWGGLFQCACAHDRSLQACVRLGATTRFSASTPRRYHDGTNGKFRPIPTRLDQG